MHGWRLPNDGHKCPALRVTSAPHSGSQVPRTQGHKCPVLRVTSVLNSGSQVPALRVTSAPHSGSQVPRTQGHKCPALRVTSAPHSGSQVSCLHSGSQVPCTQGHCRVYLTKYFKNLDPQLKAKFKFINSFLPICIFSHLCRIDKTLFNL